MKKTLILSLSVAALLAFAPAVQAATEVAPAAQEAAPAAASTQTPAPVVQDNAMGAQEQGDQAASPAVEAPGAAAPAPAEHAAAEGDAADTHHAPTPPQIDWSFNGPFGTFDRAAMQRGFQVYKQVCAACHAMNHLAYRNLAALGYDEAEIKSIAAEATITDGPNDEGDMFERPGKPSDRFKAPFANEKAARAANGGAMPPDLSLIVRARADGSNYVHGILTGYEKAPAGFALNPGMSYNKYFLGHQIAMAAPLVDGSVTYDDGTVATVDQMARDVSTFLTWASEPVMEQRKQTGIKVLIFLAVFVGLMYLTKRKVWKDLH